MSGHLDGRVFALCALLALCTNFFEAFSSSYPAESNPSFLHFFNNSYIDRGHSAGVGELVLECFWSVSLYAAPFGNMFGCMIAPLCTERYGRRNSLLLANTYGLVASLVSAAAIVFEFPELLIIARLVASTSATVGLLALILFLQEVPDVSKRGLFSFLCALSISVVECVALLLNMIAPSLGHFLLFLVAFPILPQFVGILLAMLLRETPQFLLLRMGKKDKAAQAMAFYRRGLSTEDIQQAMDKVCADHTDCPDCALLKQPLKAFCAILGQRKWRTAALLGFCTLQITVGGWPILESSVEILSEHFGTTFAERTSFVLVLAYFLSSLTGLFCVERLNRRPLILRSALFNILSLCLYIGFHWASAHWADWLGYACLPCILLFAISLGYFCGKLPSTSKLSFALGPVSYFLCAELLPLPCALSSILLSLLFVTNILSTFFLDWATPLLFGKVSAWAFLPLYVLPALICYVPLRFWLAETRGREKTDIVRELAKIHD